MTTDLINTSVKLGPLAEEMRFFSSAARAPRIRTMRQFAEEEIILPDGPFAGLRFRCDRQPFTRLFFDQVDTGAWWEINVTGPGQASKSTISFIIPALYHLFELKETVVLGVPDEDMAADKWFKDIRPVLDRTRYAGLLRKSGEGSRGGKVDLVQFTNGAMLKFMSAAGRDKSKAGFTARVLCATEIDGMAVSASTSMEANPLEQMMARLRASKIALRRIYCECTVSTAGGAIWQRIKNGTDSRIACPCPKCRAYVTPEREHLVGWQEATDEIDAYEKGRFCCPNCGAAFSPEERRQANLQAVLLHKGQEMIRSEDGTYALAGPAPRTKSLGFRWNAFNNLFLDAGDVAVDEWKAARAANRDDAERKMCQFVHCIPYQPPVTDLSALEFSTLIQRTRAPGRGIVPEGTRWLTAAIDLGKFRAHYMVIAWRAEGGGQIIEYGELEIPTGSFGVEKATLLTLVEFRDRCLAGWPLEERAETMSPARVLVDSGWGETTPTVYQFCREAISKNARFLPAKGCGMGKQYGSRYRTPQKSGERIAQIGEGYHIAFQETGGVFLMLVDADHWKSFVHERLNVPLNHVSAVTLFDAAPSEHMPLARHLTAEKRIEEFVEGVGNIVRWHREHRENHWFDCAYNCAAAAHLQGMRVLPAGEATARAAGRNELRTRGLTTPFGQNFLVTAR